ncbi:MAG TPA: SdiA-regulated domain-containing protein [Flavobacteriaceae bacterium]|nr:SdiA-regulated domain-containing protein [Flavobacteriaceae bacterium]MCB9212506.1 SdiA-regulated domain-containing protein [Alteromonas sp.]HPF10569.1 SdiA-regulated domain-containing protein [Flavobacteriaceae bacterium]HQU20851.1 SdiA-regulated domain-containing protein [Flavobacteriaceae bacterium]HQU64335.1 SdiA-regulated domain-containing protein [Flavobacteriaceae bacterium]
MKKLFLIAFLFPLFQSEIKTELVYTGRTVKIHEFAGTKDLESVVKIDAEDIFVVADDDSDGIFFIDIKNKKVLQAFHANDFISRFSKIKSKHTKEFEGLCYDYNTQNIYLANSPLNSKESPAIFLLKRNFYGYKIEDYRIPLITGENQLTAIAYSPFGILIANGSEVKKYDFDSNVVDNEIILSLNEVIYEMYYFENAFWVLTNKNMLYKYGWNQFNKPIQSYDLSLIDKEPNWRRIKDARSIIVQEDLIIIGDGRDRNERLIYLQEKEMD